MSETAESRILTADPLGGVCLIPVIEALVRDWKGDPSPCEVPAAPLPKVLRAFYQAVGGGLAQVCVQNDILAAEDLETREGKVVFARESQGVVVWGVDSGTADPEVFCWFHEVGAWMPDVPRLSQFLLQFISFESLMSAPFGAAVSNLSGPELRTVTAPLRSFDYPEWHWPSYPGRFFVRRNAFAFACPNIGARDPEDCPPWSFWFGARDRDGASLLEGLTGSDWEYVALT